MEYKGICTYLSPHDVAILLFQESFFSSRLLLQLVTQSTTDSSDERTQDEWWVRCLKSLRVLGIAACDRPQLLYEFRKGKLFEMIIAVLMWKLESLDGSKSFTSFQIQCIKKIIDIRITFVDLRKTFR